MPTSPQLAAEPPAPPGVAPEISVVVPFYNEQGVVSELHERLSKVMRGLGRPYELVFVNDGSRDDTGLLLAQAAAADEHVVFVDLRRNFGQTAALQAGFDHAAGDIVVAMDGDLQHDPYEIPLFVAKLEEGYDVVSGWRVRRGDGLLLRRLPSRAANWLLGRVSGVNLHDFGTTFKAYRRSVLADVRLYGDMHRYVPAVIARWGGRIAELPIKNVRRRAGRSNYGIGRTLRVALDLLTLRFMTVYLTRPMHFFGKGGLACVLAGLAVLGFILARKLMDWGNFHVMTRHGPLMMVGVLLVLAGLLFFSTGLMGEMLMRLYFEGTGRRTYAVRQVVRRGR